MDIVKLRGNARECAAAVPWGGKLKDRAAFVDAYLKTCFTEQAIPERLREAMRYSLLAGGKRLRPVLCLSAAHMCGAPVERVLPFAAALEMIHTYSLIHDDLPSMDNDALRRGKPTCHIAHGEATALLAGDALLTDAFSAMTAAEADPARLLDAVRTISCAAGSAGMAGGQQLDLEEDSSKTGRAELTRINELKTGALITAACETGAILGGASEEQRSALVLYGKALGTAFQITDDLIDATGSTEEAGKQTGKDAENGKIIWPALIGINESRRLASDYCRQAAAAIEGTLFDSPEEKAFLISVAENMDSRNR